MSVEGLVAPVVTACANRPRAEELVGVPRLGDLVGPGAAEIGDYAVARMTPLGFGRLIAAARRADSADAPWGRPPGGRGRRMSDQVPQVWASPTGPTG